MNYYQEASALFTGRISPLSCFEFKGGKYCLSDFSLKNVKKRYTIKRFKHGNNIMKIQGPSESQKTGKAKSASPTGKSNGAFGAMVTGAAKEASGLVAPGSVASVDALLAVQAAEDPTERAAKRRMRERGVTLLEKLDEIRLGLLTGNMTVGQVIGIADVVASHREKVSDPKMSALLDEIDLRAQIEIAKMRKAIH